MKKYLLPTLISLALTHTGVLAEEAATSEAAASPEPQAESTASPAESATPATPPSAESIKNKPQELMEKHRSHQEYMREQMQKLYQTDDPEERNRLMEEMQQRRAEMRKEMMDSSGFTPGWGGGPGPRWGGDPRWGGGPWNNGPRWGGPGPNWGGPNWGGRGPQWNGPDYYDMPPRGPSRAPHFFNKGMAGGHQARVEQRLENIEQVLKQIADALTQQNQK